MRSMALDAQGQQRATSVGMMLWFRQSKMLSVRRLQILLLTAASLKVLGTSSPSKGAVPNRNF